MSFRPPTFHSHIGVLKYVRSWTYSWWQDTPASDSTWVIELSCAWSPWDLSLSRLQQVSSELLHRLGSVTDGDVVRDDKVGSTLLGFLCMRFPTSGKFSHSWLVTTDNPRPKSANCCCIFRRYVWCWANSAFLHTIVSETHRCKLIPMLISASPCWSYIYCLFLHRLVYMSYLRIDHICYPGLGIINWGWLVLCHVWSMPLCWQWIYIRRSEKRIDTYATASVDGPSYDGPTLEHVVKPELLRLVVRLPLPWDRQWKVCQLMNSRWCHEANQSRKWWVHLTFNIWGQYMQ